MISPLMRMWSAVFDPGIAHSTSAKEHVSAVRSATRSARRSSQPRLRLSPVLPVDPAAAAFAATPRATKPSTTDSPAASARCNELVGLGVSRRSGHTIEPPGSSPLGRKYPPRGRLNLHLRQPGRVLLVVTLILW